MVQTRVGQITANIQPTKTESRRSRKPKQINNKQGD